MEKDAATVHERLRKWRRVDDVDTLRRRVHRAIRTVEMIMYHESTPDTERRKCATVIGQLARTHLKLIESAELEERITRLEEFHQNGTAVN